MQWSVPRELLWAIIFGLAVTVAVLWPLHYPYSQAPKVDSQHQAKDAVSSQDSAAHGPSSQVNPGGGQQSQHGGEHAAETTVLWIKPGEWLLGIVTWMLWLATVKLVRGAENTAQRQLRAYVFVVQGRVRRFVVGEPVEITITIKNTGQTPAYQFRNCMALAMTKNPPMEEFPELEWGAPRASSLGPDQVSSNFGRFPGYTLSNAHMTDIKSGKAAIWAYGEVRYADAFGKQHVTKFKFVFEGDIVTDPPGGMYSAADGNEAT